MSKEREDFEALFPKDGLEKVKNTETIEAAFKGYLLGRAHYQPLLDAKDAEIAKFRLKLAEMREELAADTRLITGFEARLEAKDAEIATLKALLEQAREDLSMFMRESQRNDISSIDIVNDFIPVAHKTLVAINAATGEK